MNAAHKTGEVLDMCFFKLFETLALDGCKDTVAAFRRVSAYVLVIDQVRGYGKDEGH